MALGFALFVILSEAKNLPWPTLGQALYSWLVLNEFPRFARDDNFRPDDMNPPLIFFLFDSNREP